MNTADSYEVLDVSDTADAERLDSGASHDAEGLFSHIGHAIGGAVRGVGHAVGSAARTVGKGVKVAGKVLRDVAPIAQTVLSVIPGVGQGASAAIGAAVALSEGKPITDAVLAGVKGALPGGPLAQRAFDAATAIGSGLLKGQKIDQVALDAARSQLPGGDVARVAFDTGLALAHGKSIQEAGLQGALHLLPDSPLARSAYSAGKQLVAAGHVDRALASAAQSAVGLPGVQTPRIRDLSGSSPLAVMRTLSPRVSTIAAALLRQPQLRGLPLAQVARTLDAPESQVRQAMSAIVATARRMGGVEQLNVPTLVRNVDLERMLGPDVSLDRALAQFGSRAAPNQSSPRPTRRPRIRWDRLDADEVRRILALLSRSRQREASGLDSTGTKWIVDPGDFAMKIAKKLTGSEGRYRELFAANPQKPLLADGSNWVSLQPGEVLNLPPSWIQTPPTPGPSPAPVTPVIPSVPVAPVSPPSPAPAPVSPPAPVTPPLPAPVFPSKPFGPPSPAPAPAPSPAPQQASTDSGGSGMLIPLAIGGVALFLLGKK